MLDDTAPENCVLGVDEHAEHIKDELAIETPHNEHVENGTEYVNPTLKAAEANVVRTQDAVADDTGFA